MLCILKIVDGDVKGWIIATDTRMLAAGQWVCYRMSGRELAQALFRRPVSTIYGRGHRWD